MNATALALAYLVGFTVGVWGTICAYALGKTWTRLREKGRRA